ncbi:MAG: hypothetical protein KGV43_01200 [Arcobacter sp.]|nr:hypothetical protein [Arcobacter sp.]
MYRKFFLLIFILLFSACSFNQKSILKQKVEKEKPFEYKRPKISQELLSVIHNIIEDMQTFNLITINKKYIHPSFGLYNLSKIDGIKTFTFQNQIYNVVESNSDEFSQFMKRLDKKTSKKQIKYKDINFNCSPYNDAFYGWNNYGVFFSSKTKNYLSDLMKKENKIALKYKKEDFHKAKMIEKMSYRVVITPEIVFYLTPIENKWYITLIDRISTDCSSPK